MEERAGPGGTLPHPDPTLGTPSALQLCPGCVGAFEQTVSLKGADGNTRKENVINSADGLPPLSLQITFNLSYLFVTIN